MGFFDLLRANTEKDVPSQVAGIDPEELAEELLAASRMPHDRWQALRRHVYAMA